MEEIKIIEAIVIMMFIFPGLAFMMMMFLAVFIHISFNRTGLASLFYEEMLQEKMYFFPKMQSPMADSYHLHGIEPDL